MYHNALGLEWFCQSSVWKRDPAASCAIGSTYSGGACRTITSLVTGPVSGSVISTNDGINPCPAGQHRVTTGPIIGFGSYYAICVKN